MRLPQRIFLNVVIFVSSFLGQPRTIPAVSALRIMRYCLSSIVPQDGTVHNVLYRYLFRTIFLFRPSAPAAPCSRIFLLSYCSTPPLKRKIKFSLQTVPFVPTPAAFFRRRAGLLSGAHFLPERGGGGWNPRHSFLQVVLLSAAQFAGQPLLYRLLSCTQFRGAGVGIPRTVYGGRGCYRQHNFGAVCIAGQKKWLLSGAQFGLFSAGGRLLSTAQFARWVKFGYCYRQHISEFRLLSKRVRTGLLSSAHFRQWGCYRAHSFQTVEFWRLLLSTAQF